MNKEKVYQNLIFIGGLLELYLGWFSDYPLLIQLFFCWFLGQSTGVQLSWDSWWKRHLTEKRFQEARKLWHTELKLRGLK